jgi:predicted NUDIX family NTP pyrophosphohydrolase
MAKKLSAGLIIYREGAEGVEVLIAHMGGPYWAKKDDGGWSIPKGEYDEGAEPLEVAHREFEEELGAPPPPGDRLDLGELRQPNGKRIQAWAILGDFDASDIHSNQFEIEWPPRSGKMQSFPEVDRAGWFGLGQARRKLVKGQVPFVDRLAEHLGVDAVEEVPEPRDETPDTLF